MLLDPVIKPPSLKKSAAYSGFLYILSPKDATGNLKFFYTLVTHFSFNIDILIFISFPSFLQFHVSFHNELVEMFISHMEHPLDALTILLLDDFFML